MSMQSIRALLPRVLRDLGLEHGVAGWRAVEEWSEAAGDRIASRTRALSFHEGTLHVEVEGSAWLHELGYLKRELLRQVNRRLGSAQVRELRFTIARGGIRR
jgi:predicted nucleic acid-binding Zn ribbon protein